MIGELPFLYRLLFCAYRFFCCEIGVLSINLRCF